MIKIIEHPQVRSDVGIILKNGFSDHQSNSAIERISYHLAIEATKYQNTDIVLVSILPSGLHLLSSFMNVIPSAQTAFIGFENEGDNEFDLTFYSVNHFHKDSKYIILDSHNRFGNRASSTISRMELDGISDIIYVSIITESEGLERIRAEFPNVKIISAFLDGIN